MSWLAVWLVGVGLADLVRAAAGTSTTALRLAMGSGAAAVAVLAALTALTAPIDLVCLAVSQRVRADGIGAVLAAQDLLRGLA